MPSDGQPRRDRLEHFADPKLGRFDVRISAGTTYITVGGFKVPEAFSIERPRRAERRERDFPIIDVEIEDGQPRCVGIRRRPGGPPLTGEAIRGVPLTEFVQAAAYALALERAGTHEGVELWRHAMGRVARDEFEHAVGPRGRGNRISDEFLAAVAAVYRQALVAGMPPTRAVGEAFSGSGGTPGRWVQEARRRGFLGPARGTKAGEAGHE